MINLARFPEVQNKLYKILEAQDFRADEFKDCPYLQAVIYEIHRYCPMIYRSLVHSITEKTEILGQEISKRSANINMLLGETFEKDELICFSITGANMNEKYFKVSILWDVCVSVYSKFQGRLFSNNPYLGSLEISTRKTPERKR